MKMTTPVNLTALRAPMQAVHDSGVNLTLSWRREQLCRLTRLLEDCRDDLINALHEDLGKDRIESAGTELHLIKAEIGVALASLRKWMRPEKVGAPAVLMPSFHRIEKRPLLGPAVLIIGPFNYPVNLTLLPAVGALAAGNPVVIKPSEQTPKTSDVLAKAVESHFEPGVMRVVRGGVPVATELLKLKWGTIFFTGSERVGKIVAKAAVDTLTPVVLELGGKSPVIVDETAPSDLMIVANRIAWAKLLNTGQTCCAPDYLLVHESKVDKLMEYMVHSIHLQFGDNPRASELGRIVTKGHAQRLLDMIVEAEKDDKTQMLLGCSSDCDPSERYICPTIVKDVPDAARLWKEEIFGPILPVKTFRSRQEAIEAVRCMPGTPLALYVFTRQEKVLKEYMAQIRAGAVFRNDCLMHVGSSLMPFGGLGSSGYGNYHGKHSFDTFSQSLTVSFRPAWAGSDFGMARYHPLEGVKGWLLLNVLVKLPNVPVLHSRLVLLATVAAGVGSALYMFMANTD